MGPLCLWQCFFLSLTLEIKSILPPYRSPSSPVWVHLLSSWEFCFTTLPSEWTPGEFFIFQQLYSELGFLLQAFGNAAPGSSWLRQNVHPEGLAQTIEQCNQEFGELSTNMKLMPSLLSLWYWVMFLTHTNITLVHQSLDIVLGVSIQMSESVIHNKVHHFVS